MKKKYIIKIISTYSREIIIKKYFRTNRNDVVRVCEGYLLDRLSMMGEGFCFDERYFTPFELLSINNATHYNSKKEAEKAIRCHYKSKYHNKKYNYEYNCNLHLEKRIYEIKEIYA